MNELFLIKELKFFTENPYKEVYLRELATKLKISPFAAKKYSDLLIREGLLTEEKKANLRIFRANMSNLFFRQLKIAFSIESILKSGLIEHLNKNIPNLSSIVLFGSKAKGEDDEKSDFDMLVIGKAKHIDLSAFETKLNREINIHFLSWGDWNKSARENSAFYYEVISRGIPLIGDLPIVKWK
ncbi:nucleotidyltransferase domain-containing protein [Candidatus Woesearchaeota archaeon]|nr:nucleotidyltransferase domain-containing protein [Candidatus Woesearchaeota archaeon]